MPFRISIPSIILSLVLLFCGRLDATHNRAGEITYVQLDEVTIEATITTYTRTSSFSVDRDSLEIFWGDGTSTIIFRTEEVELPNDIKLNRYTSQHAYPSRGTYTMSVVDPNRIAGILNIDFPNSVDIQFYIETTFTLLDQRFEGANSSVVLLQPPIDFACPNRPYSYNPNAFDPDGDSLSFELITPFQSEGIEVPNYNLPDEISPGPENMISLDKQTGDFLWETPQLQGEYNITYRINEFRNGVLINSMVRDMQILVRPCIDENNPPIVELPDRICVIAGDLVQIPFRAFDLDTGEIVSISIIGGPLEISPDSAYVELDLNNIDSVKSGTIHWQTTCDHIAEEYYKIVVRATDIDSRPMTALATLKTVLIKVLGPSPIIADVQKENEVINIEWNQPYACEQGSLFQGFSVWRREGGDNLRVDSCQGGLEGSGYEKIVFLTSERNGENYFAQDVELESGKIYCYRVIAEFAQLTESGNLYNRSASLPSEPLCIRSSGEEPIITHVSVIETDNASGSIYVEWLLPDGSQIDTTELIGPYNISISQGEGFRGRGDELIDIQSTTLLSELSDTSFLVESLNTGAAPYNYSVLFSSGNLEFSSTQASSIFLDIIPSDEELLLSWNEDVPWFNYSYCIYGVDDSGQLNFIDSTADMNYTVSNLENGAEYCFVIESKGRYGLKELNEPLLNFSNQSCGSPRDNVSPCEPNFEVASVCDEPDAGIGDEILINVITWSSCPDTDIAGYRVYFSPDTQENKILLEEFDASVSRFEHRLADNIAGCYEVTSYDLSGNESNPLEEFCVDNCPTYILPNAFTPNADQSNDLFVPRVNQFIEEVVFEVYNRWGQKVWESNDPQLNWDGRNFAAKELAEGTYYYTCTIFERRVTGIFENPDVLKGTIQLLR